MSIGNGPARNIEERVAELEQNLNKWKGLLVKADNEQSERIEQIEQKLDFIIKKVKKWCCDEE